MAKILTDLAFKLSSDVAELKTGLNKANKQLTGFQSQVGNIGKLIAGAFAADQLLDWGKALTKVSGEMLNTKSVLKNLGLTNADTIDAMTGKVHGLATTYEQSTEDILKSARALSKQLGISIGKALELINKGLAVSGKEGGEFLAQIKEYPAQFRAAGLSADQAVGLISQSIKDGIFSDKGADTIKEATLRLREFTPVTKDAIEGIGLSSEEMQKGIENGTISMVEAIAQIATKMGTLPESSNEVGTAIADIFGGAGEDAGLQFITGLANGIEGIDEVLAGDALARSKKELADAAIKIGIAWSSVLGKDASWWQGFKADVLSFTGSSIAFLTRGMSGLVDLETKLVIASGQFEKNNEEAEDSMEGYSTALEDAQRSMSAIRWDIQLGNELTKEQKALWDIALKQFIIDSQTSLDLMKLQNEQAKMRNDLAEELRKISKPENVGETIQRVSTHADPIPDLGVSGILDMFGDAPAIAGDDLISSEAIQKGQEFIKIQKQIKLESEAMTEGINGITDSIFGFIGAINLADDNWAQVASSIFALIGKLINEFVALMAAGVIAREGSTKGLLGIATASTAIAGFLALLSSVRKKATGGLAEGLTIVGERGPELVNFGETARVYSAANTKAMLGGGEGGQVRFVIEGDKLVGAIQNYQNKYNTF